MSTKVYFNINHVVVLSHLLQQLKQNVHYRYLQTDRKLCEYVCLMYLGNNLYCKGIGHGKKKSKSAACKMALRKLLIE